MKLVGNKETYIAILALIGIALYAALLLFPALASGNILASSGLANGLKGNPYNLKWSDAPLLIVLLSGGSVLVVDLLHQLLRREFGSDLLAGISIVTSLLLHEYLAGVLVVLMLSGGQALEAYAIRSASSVLELLSKRLPAVAHKKMGDGIEDVNLEKLEIGDLVAVFPHEICPVDGTVVEGHGSMDEAYLTGEPYNISKAPGSGVLSGSVNGESALTIKMSKKAVDSRYAKVMEVMRSSAQQRPQLRRIADQLGAYYTPLAVLIALAAWLMSGDSIRFLAVLVVATPCPLLIAIPVTIIGSISLAARRGIIIKDPAILERIGTCRTAIFDKTGTLTYGRPALTEILATGPLDQKSVLTLTASLERYSKHPLAAAILDKAEAENLNLLPVHDMSEIPGEGLIGSVDGKHVEVTGRKVALKRSPELSQSLPEQVGGMECTILIDDTYAATMRFRDEPRKGSSSFVTHLSPKHHFTRVILLSGDRESEVKYLAEQVGIKDVYYGQSPEEKLEMVRKETKLAPTLFLGDGINDAPALTAATVGIALGQDNDITAEASGAVILDSSLTKVDELLHIGNRMRTIALQSAYGGMGLSLIGMIFAAGGHLPPVAGAICQEAIDVIAVLNALRVAIVPKSLSDI